MCVCVYTHMRIHCIQECRSLCVHMGIPAYTCVCPSVRVGQRSTTGVFLYHFSFSFFFRNYFSVDLELVISARLLAREPLRAAYFCLIYTGITWAYPPCLGFFVWVLGIQTQVVVDCTLTLPNEPHPTPDVSNPGPHT